MTEIIQNFKLNLHIRLTLERWSHILEAHPELKQFKRKVIATIREPTNVYYSNINKYNIFIKSFNDFITDYLVVYVKKLEKDAFIITSHPISHKRLERKIKSWKKLNL